MTEYKPIYDHEGTEIGQIPQATQTRKTYGRSYYLGMSDRLTELVRNPKLNNADKVVLHDLLLRLEFDTPKLRLNLAEIGRDLGMARATVSRSVSKLVDNGALIRVHNRGNNYDYYMDPHVGFRGQQDKFEQAQRLINQILWDRLDGKGQA